MSKIRKQFLVITVISLLFLSGCGSSLYELSESEQDMVVHYAASVVAKHNKQQKDGLIAVTQEEPVLEPIENSETDKNSIDSSSENSETEQQTEAAVELEMSIAEAIGHANDLQITYQGYDVQTNYKGASYYSLQAPQGYQYLILKFRISNEGADSVQIDNLSYQPDFSLVMDGNTYYSEVTIALDDFSSYQGTIHSGESVDTVLLFKIPQNIDNQLEHFRLQRKFEDKTYQIKL